MSFASPFNEFRSHQKNDANSSNLGAGVQFTVGTGNSMGSWVDLFGGTITDDSYGLYVTFNNFVTSGQSRPVLADIGVDVSGGTSYTVLIPYLSACNALVRGGSIPIGYSYYFPIFMKAGSRLAVRGQTSGSAQAGWCRAWVFSRPTHPECVRAGSWVEAVGVTSSTSVGTSVTAGTGGTPGSWALLGSPSRDGWWIQAGVSDSTGTMHGGLYFFDIAYGDGSNKRVVIPNLYVTTANTNDMAMEMPLDFMCQMSARTVGSFYARASYQNATADTGMSAMVYVLGG